MKTMEDMNQKIWDTLALRYQNKFMSLDVYNDTYDLFCHLLKKENPKILEIGCGPGNITKYLLDKRADFKIEAIDYAPEMIHLAKQNNPAAEFRIMDCREFDTIKTMYDAIVCGFCLPYLSKDETYTLFGNCQKIMNRDALFYFSAIEGDYSKSGLESSSDGTVKMWIYYHQKEYLLQWMDEYNFELQNYFQKEYRDENNISHTHMIFIAKSTN